MHRRTLIGAVAAACALGCAAAVAAAPASACGSLAGIHLSVLSGQPGSAFTVTGSSFMPTGTDTLGGASPVTFHWSAYDGPVIGEANADREGRVGPVDLSVPAGAAFGTVMVVAVETQLNNGQASFGTPARALFTVSPPPYLTLSNPSGTAGTPITISGADFTVVAPAGTSSVVTFHWASTRGPVIGTGEADDNGTVAPTTLAIPPKAVPGVTTIVGVQSDATGAELPGSVAGASFLVTRASRPIAPAASSGGGGGMAPAPAVAAGPPAAWRPPAPTVVAVVSGAAVLGAAALTIRARRRRGPVRR